MIIGITGGTGCGKTTLLNLIRDMGGMVLDCDEIYHRLLKTDGSLLGAIEDRFPGTVEKGELQRKKLGAIVFNDAQALLDLNRITHAAIRLEVLRQLETSPSLAAIDAIALFESGLNKLCDVTVAVTAPTVLRVQRLMARDNISEDYARSRIAAQPSNEDFSALCDYTLENSGESHVFTANCLAFFRKIGIMEL